MKLKLYNFLFLMAFALFLTADINTAFSQKVDSTLKSQSSKSKKVLYGVASYYAAKFQGRKTANGEIFDHKKFTCACNVLPLGTWVRITNLRNGRSILAKTNDRLHPRMKRLVDLTKAAATELKFVSAGLTRVKVEVLGKKRPIK